MLYTMLPQLPLLARVPGLGVSLGSREVARPATTTFSYMPRFLLVTLLETCSWPPWGQGAQ